MPKLPILSGKKLVQVLTKNGYSVLRQKGSHVFLEDNEKQIGTVVPIHKNEDLGKGLLKSILSDLELSVEDLIQMLK